MKVTASARAADLSAVSGGTDPSAPRSIRMTCWGREWGSPASIRVLVGVA